MSTSRQRAANRRNSQLSTGPRTLRGRAAVAANPLLHGFYARVAIPDLDDPAAYHATLADFLADLRPAGAVEVELVHRYVKDLWKLRRFERLERMFFVDAIECNEPRVAARITDPEQRAGRACFDAIETQLIQFRTVAPLERVALLTHRLRRALDSTLRLLRELQAERLASAAPGETPFAVLDTLPPDPLDYTVDSGPPAPSSPVDAPAAPVSPESPVAQPPAAEPCATDPRVAEPPVSEPRPSGSGCFEPPVAEPRIATPPSAPSTPPNSPETPPASPTIHKLNPEIGFAPSKMQSTPPPPTSNPVSRRYSKHPSHPRP
ncbi:MAG: hypothetical protein ABSC08_06115 [Bryobacteraceae bacterium]|jgi:hypothetical protein